MLHEDPPIISDAHLKAVKQLESRGIGVGIEAFFPPFSVDCYISEFHMGVEVDGPYHKMHRKRDKERDKILREEYGLIIFRVSVRDVNSKKSNWIDSFLTLAEQHLETVEERFELCRMKCSWI